MSNDSPTAFRLVAAASLVILALSSGPALAQAPSPEAPGQGPQDRLTEQRTTSLELRGAVDDEEYIVGPGDRFSITIWGQSITTASAAVTPEGDLVLPGVATVPVAGRTLADVKDDVRDRLGALYTNSEVSVALTALRRIQVNVLGAVRDPGPYVVTALSPASQLVRMAGGLIEGASERNIVISRRGGQRERLDMTRYHNTGDLGSDPPILDGDVIFVPHATAFVSVHGGVARPGEYELVEGETIASLIEVAGGFARGALADTVELTTFVDESTRRSLLLDTTLPGARGHALRDGDQVVVRFDSDWRALTRVEVDGEVAFPGEYGISEGVDRLSDVVRRAGGPTDGASLVLARLIRTSARRGRDLEYERLSDMDVGDMTSEEYAYLKSRTRQLPGTVSVDFERALGGDEAHDVLLMDGDRIEIPKLETTVEVIGQVARPGRVAHVPGERYGYYVRRAGGYSPDANRGAAKVIKGSTGERRRARTAGTLDAGDVVWIPEGEDVDWWGIVKDVAAFASTVATLYLIIDRP